MRKVRYIGSFPPPYGGVTVKNKLLFDKLSKEIDIRHMKKPAWLPGALHQLLLFCTALLPGQTLLIGVSGKGGKSVLLTRLLFIFNKNTMVRSLYFMMGGTECYRIGKNPKEIRWYSTYKKIYAETSSMVTYLQNAGLNNVSRFPNCRAKPANSIQSSQHKETSRLKCVFFSIIMPEKGVDLILEAAMHLPDIDFAFYGEIVEEYKNAFLDKVAMLSNSTYFGVFKGTSEQVYQELSKYDVLLLPTNWDNEGVPGVLVEAKITGLPCIVSDRCYNSELVADRIDGIVLSNNDADHLIDAIKMLEMDRGMLKRLSIGSAQSAEQYYIENYINEIIREIG